MSLTPKAFFDWQSLDVFVQVAESIDKHSLAPLLSTSFKQIAPLILTKLSVKWFGKVGVDVRNTTLHLRYDASCSFKLLREILESCG